jgi:hypothetical protein
MSAERAVLLAAELYSARESVRFLFGDKYEEKIAPLREAVRGAVKRFSCGALATVPEIIKAARADGQDMDGVAVVCLMAAAVDVAEDV